MVASRVVGDGILERGAVGRQGTIEIDGHIRPHEGRAASEGRGVCVRKVRVWGRAADAFHGDLYGIVYGASRGQAADLAAIDLLLDFVRLLEDGEGTKVRRDGRPVCPRAARRRRTGIVHHAVVEVAEVVFGVRVARHALHRDVGESEGVFVLRGYDDVVRSLVRG